MISTVPDKIVEMILSREMEFNDFNFKPSKWEDVFVVELLRWYDTKIKIMPDIKRDSSINWYYNWKTYYEQFVRIFYYYVKRSGIKDYDNLYKIFRYLFSVDKNDNPYRDSYDMISAEKLMNVYNYLSRKVSDYSIKSNIYDKDYEGYIVPLVGIWRTEEMRIKLSHIKISKNNKVYINKNNFIDISPKNLYIKDDNEKIELCKEFYNEYKRLPKNKEKYKDFNIGIFINHLKQGKNSHLKEEVENIFNNKIYANKKLNLKDDNEKIELCKEFYNEYKRLPKINEIYKDFKIGKFIDNLKRGKNSHLKEEVENIFNNKIYVKTILLKDDNEKLELCKSFYNEYKRLPKQNESYKDFNIGNFINYLKYGYNSHLKEEVENIFNTKIEVAKKLNLKDDNEKLELCKEFYNEYKRLPKKNDTYKDFKIGNFIDNLKHGANLHLKEVESIFNTKIEVNWKLNLKDDNEKIELCKEFYNEYKRLPTWREKYKDFNIGIFINHLKQGKNSHLKEEVENIFNTKI